MENTRTFGWYARNRINSSTGMPVEIDLDETLVNAPTVRTNLENLVTLGLVDEVLSVDNLARVLSGIRNDDLVPRDYSVRPIGKGRPWETMGWILRNVFKDPTLDPAILRLALVLDPDRFMISVVSHPRCPSDVILAQLRSNGKKSDVTRVTKGGEVACFVLQNRDLSGDLVDACAKASVKANTQKDAIVHKNVKRETLVYIVNEGKTPAVKRDALMAMFERRWLEVK